MKFPRHQFQKAWEIREKFAKKQLTSEAVTREYLERAKNDTTNSYLLTMEEQALKAAKAHDQHGARSRISGIPLGLKDILVTEGVRTTCASKILGNYIPPYSATVVKKLEKAGSVFLGKLNMDEFAMGSSNENSAFGPVKLPQAPDRVPGGSSGASGAALSGNMAVLTLGTDTGGSVRQPASFCGVIGLKPTYGRVSRYGLIAFASSLDQVGPMALDAQDTADLLEAVSGFDERDSTSAQTPVPKFGEEVEKIRTDKGARAAHLKNLRVGMPKEFFADGIDPKVRANVEHAIKSMEAAGAKIVPISLPNAKYALAVYYVVAVSEASANLARFDGVRFGPRIMPKGTETTLEEMYETTRGELFGPEVKRRIILGTFALSSGYYDAYYKKACQVRNLIAQDFGKAFKECDVIAGPTTPTVSFKRGAKIEDPLTMYLNDVFTVPVNLAGIPALSMPYGTGEDGLPVGLQFIGPAFSEAMLLKTACATEFLYDEKGGV